MTGGSGSWKPRGEYGLASLRKSRMSGVFESQLGNFQNNWLEIKVSKNLSPFPFSLPSDSRGWPLGSYSVNWSCRELALHGWSPLIVSPSSRASSHSGYSPAQSVLYRQRGRGSFLRTAWSTGTHLLPAAPLPPASSSSPGLQGCLSRILQQQQQQQSASDCPGICVFPTCSLGRALSSPSRRPGKDGAREQDRMQKMSLGHI